MQLQRSLYLLGREYRKLTGPAFHKFRTISSGHFSEDVYTDAEALAAKGLVALDVSEGGQRAYRVTEAGRERAKALEKQVSAETIQFLRRTGAWVRTRSVEQLVRSAHEPPPPPVITARKPPARSQR